MHSLRFKFIAPFVAGALLLTLILSWYCYSSVRYTVTQGINVLSAVQTKQASKTVTQFLNYLSGSLQKIASDQNVTTLFSPNQPENFVEQMQLWLDVIIQGNDQLRNIFIVDKNGICIAAHSQMQLGISYANRPSVIEALKGAAAFGVMKVTHITNTLSVAAANPVIIDGQVVGAVVAVSDHPNIVSYQDTTHHDLQALFTTFLSPQGAFLVHRDRTIPAAGGKFANLYARLAEAGRFGQEVSFNLEGRQYVGFAQLEPVSKWLIITCGLESEVFASASRIGIMVFSISLLIMCIICFVVIKFSGSLLSSLLSLITYAKDVSENKPHIVLPPTTRNDELGVLHGALQRLVESLRNMLRQSQQASTMKSQFLANMSHEIRTPLNAIVGMTHLASVEQNLTQSERGYMENIQAAARTLLGIINDILDISKIEAGMFALDHTPFNLRRTIDDVMLLHQEQARKKNITLAIDYQTGTPDFLLGDPIRLGQVLNNLLSNAVKFTEQGGVSVVCSCPCMLDGDQAIIKISVTDSGIGIDRETMQNLFQPFTQADASITRRFGGTGLGLAISDKIVKMMQGSFAVESLVGQGTTFTFEVRLQLDHSPQMDIGPGLSINEALSQLELQGKWILIAEDNKVNQIILKKFLLLTGAEMEIVENGALAVEAARQKRFDIIFMDMQMPIMGGIEATIAIREFTEVPIIAVTANAFKETKDLAMASGINDYITKPIEPFQLISILRKWV